MSLLLHRDVAIGGDGKAVGQGMDEDLTTINKGRLLLLSYGAVLAQKPEARHKIRE